MKRSDRYKMNTWARAKALLNQCIDEEIRSIRKDDDAAKLSLALLRTSCNQRIDAEISSFGVAGNDQPAA
jgi:hypothetical protein